MNQAVVEFEANTFPLEPGIRLLEASAGTGKTFALAHLVLRLITRAADPLPLDQLLVVTYTEAAAAELRDRIAQRLQQALAALEPGDGSEDPVLLAWRAVEAADSRFTVLREQLGAWTRRWNLDADWMRDAALQTVSLWAKDQQIHEARMWALPPFDAYLTRESSIELPVWSYASEEGLKAYRKRAREYVLAAVDRHVENLRTSARAEGVPTEIRELDVPSYIWTIRHQLGGEAQNRIAEDVGVDKSRVGKNIRTLLDLLQIPPRVRLGR